MNPGSAPGGNTMTASSPASLVCPAGRWTASGSLRGSTLQMEEGEEKDLGQRGLGEKLPEADN